MLDSTTCPPKGGKERYPKFAQPTVLKLYQGIRSLKATPYRDRRAARKLRASWFAPPPCIVVYRVKVPCARWERICAVASLQQERREMPAAGSVDPPVAASA